MKRTIGLVSLAAIISTSAFAEDNAPATSSDTAVVTAPAQPAVAIDCNYVIPSDTKQIDPAIITQWAEKATIQSFDYDFNTIDGQLDKLKVCFTDEGWTGFNDALKKSGNVEAIKSQHLAVSAMATGKSSMQTIKENQWKLTIPMQVVYQNSEEKLTQKLNVDVLVGRKPSGNLGILQMIATPEKATASNPTPDAATPASTGATATPEATPAATTETPATTNTNTSETPQTATPAATPSITTPEIPATSATPAATTPTTTPDAAATSATPAATTSTPQTTNTQQ